jgi:hypothetical protein
MRTIALVIFLFSLPGFAAEEGMKSMPKISPRKGFVIGSPAEGELLREDAGFGAKEPVVRMKNLMMVGGSGYEGMNMLAGAPGTEPAESGHGHQHPEPAAAQAEDPYHFEVEPNPAILGTSTMTITAKDRISGKPAAGLKIQVRVSMATMDMGTEEPKVRETAPGKYQFKAAFSMKGLWSVMLNLPKTERSFTIEVK